MRDSGNRARQSPGEEARDTHYSDYLIRPVLLPPVNL